MTRKKREMDPNSRAGVIPVELFSYVLSPERLERLKRYAAMYIAKYGIETETKPKESEVK